MKLHHFQVVSLAILNWDGQIFRNVLPAQAYHLCVAVARTLERWPILSLREITRFAIVWLC